MFAPGSWLVYVSIFFVVSSAESGSENSNEIGETLFKIGKDLVDGDHSNPSFFQDNIRPQLKNLSNLIGDIYMDDATSDKVEDAIIQWIESEHDDLKSKLSELAEQGQLKEQNVHKIIKDGLEKNPQVKHAIGIVVKAEGIEKIRQILDKLTPNMEKFKKGMRQASNFLQKWFYARPLKAIVRTVFEGLGLVGALFFGSIAFLFEALSKKIRVKSNRAWLMGWAMIKSIFMTVFDFSSESLPTIESMRH